MIIVFTIVLNFEYYNKYLQKKKKHNKLNYKIVFVLNQIINMQVCTK